MDKTRPITPPGRIACDPPKITTRLELLEHVNRLNIEAIAKASGERYWTVTVLYNTVIYKATTAIDAKGPADIAIIAEVFEGVLK